MAFSAAQVTSAQQWIHEIGLQRATATYGDFAAQFGLGSPYENKLMDLYLAAVLHDCASKGWPDLAALVIHQANTGQREGPGDAWYKEHGFVVGNVQLWRKWRDDCWNRINTFTP